MEPAGNDEMGWPRPSPPVLTRGARSLKPAVQALNERTLANAVPITKLSGMALPNP